MRGKLIVAAGLLLMGLGAYVGTGFNADDDYLQNKRKEAWAAVDRANVKGTYDLAKACKELKQAERNYKEYTQKKAASYQPNAEAALKCERAGY